MGKWAVVPKLIDKGHTISYIVAGMEANYAGTDKSM